MNDAVATFDPLDLVAGGVGRAPFGVELLAMQNDARLAGTPLSIEELLRLRPTCQSYPGTILDLVGVEIAESRRKGAAVDEEDYLRRFPALADALRLLLDPDFDAADLQALGRALDSVAAPAALRSTEHPFDTPASIVGTATDRLPTVEGYALLGMLGRGGMGVVYKALHLRLDRVVALKMMAGTSLNPQRRMRFLAEADAVARLHHPNIVQLYEIGEHEGASYFTLEYCPGGSLAQKLRRQAMAAREAAALVATLADAVAFAHSRQVLHRDLKPENVLLDESGSPKITDFGLARRLDEDEGLTATGDVIGTPAYMAPEQAEPKGRTVGPQADVYGLGAVLYRLLAGQPPFTGDTPVVTLRRVLNEEPAPLRSPSLPRDLEAICLKTLSKEPRHRYATAELLAADLRAFLAGSPVVARPVSAPAKALRWSRRHPALAASLAGVAAGLLAVTALSILYAVSTSRNAELERQALARKHDRDLELLGLEQSADRAIDRAYAALQAGLFEEAGRQAANAESLPRIEEQPEALRTRVDACRKDIRFADGIEKAYLLGADDFLGKPDRTETPGDKAYAIAFADRGLAILTQSAEEAGRLIRDSRNRESLYFAVLRWANETRDLAKRDALLAVACEATDDPFQRKLLAAWRDRRHDLQMLLNDDALEGQPVETVVIAANLRIGAGDVPGALRLLQAAHRRRPGDYWLNLNIGKIYYLRRDAASHADALAYFRTAVALRPRAISARHHLASILTQLDRPDEALAECHAWQTQGLDHAMIHFARARAYDRKKDSASAQAAYRRAIALDPTYWTAFYNLAVLLAQDGKTDEAKAMYAECNKLAPEVFEAWLHRGNLELRAGRYAEAEPLLREATRLSPRLAKAHSSLGIALEHLGKLDEAAAAYRLAIECDPDNATYREKLEQLEAKRMPPP